MQENFQALGYETQIAADGEEGFQLAQSFQPDVILSDIRMPKMDGFKMHEAIKAQGLQIPTLLMTGYSDYELSVLLASGVRRVFFKPVKTKEIHTFIEQELFV